MKDKVRRVDRGDAPGELLFTASDGRVIYVVVHGINDEERREQRELLLAWVNATLAQ